MRKKGDRREKKFFEDNKITMSMRKMMGYIIDLLLTKFKHFIIFRRHRIKIATGV
jgi:hypothetical protein